MSQTVAFRIVVRQPLAGVDLRLQLGKSGLVPPSTRSADQVTFEFELEAETRLDGSAVFRGPAAQGPPKARFVYINAGTYAGQADSPWSRRAKVPLTEVSGALVAKALRRPGSVIVGTADARGSDDGPAAATVSLLDGGWSLEVPGV